MCYCLNFPDKTCNWTKQHFKSKNITSWDQAHLVLFDSQSKDMASRFLKDHGTTSLMLLESAQDSANVQKVNLYLLTKLKIALVCF